MSLDTALFLVERDSVNHHVSGANAKAVMEHGDRVLVQRGGDIYTTWHSKPLPAAVPYMTWRLTYTREYDSVQDKFLHPIGDGKINFGLDFGTAGNYPAEEWRNVRNRQNSIVDLDGQPVVLKDNPDTQLDDLVQITQEGGDFECWYSLTDESSMQFQTHYDDGGRDKTNITPVKGTKPHVDDGAIVIMKFYRPAGAFDTIADDDLLLAWENNQSKHVTGANFKALFVSPGPPPIAEWTWRGYQSGSETYQLCDVRSGTAATWTANGVTYLARTDKNGVDVRDAVINAYQNSGSLWYKHDNSPSVVVTTQPLYDNTFCYIVHNAQNLSAETSATGVLRCYDYDPDAA